MKTKALFTALVVIGAASVFVWQKNSEAAGQPSGKPSRPAIAVATSQVEAHPVSRSLSLIGNLKSEHSVVIAPEVGGKISAIYVNAGEQVEEGASLLTLDTAKSQAALAEAQAFHKDELRKLREYSKLVQRGALTKTELDAQQASVDVAKARLDAATADFNDHHIKAPFSGTVGLVDITRGQLVSSGEALLNLDDLSLMQLDINVPEQYFSDLNKDIKVTARSKAWRDQVFNGQLTAVDSRVNNDTLNLRARINIDNQAGLLRPGMMMEALLDFAPQISSVIPVQAIEYSGTKRFVYLVGDDGIAKRTEVKLGARVDNKVTVENGLALGDRIVVQGLVSMRDGTKVNDLTAAKSAESGEGK
ncbi:efflux RND transporter periplasmic adaptor subunit [Enterovibrio norvegicus]|uniref:Efflux RND transporter periplasmic adaptor subunit n=1 Tax=Enterovibrio norvegicus TaxID=188144 RepID=A0A2N7L686_9GAMM|nr:efflux RND transporter periplasmic adaptor subunit [Enterovibrio norvegicus]MCC4800664.1 efflux RND transporter periplasmic adaptor subunit [Enterovibrio norvegicus]OEF55125.1 efflux transporter periplasmic adaptor subunit [Enterovibrio norvegicus]PMI33559.1 efflux transporter periplasmic adaptor subunit [Enterovibrio norvegicus]PML81078.1 efflux transporter periplasmic adaptor subunit [Enterovibrio norvegicus]PMN44212.1 efflux transporter periplasmic adaptor subunit [Enterovibrio norvegicu